ncbi:MAG: HAMP domain-containing protein [Deltaproteobacteria bacterium]|nr:HAMP domain-containing protein [Deltaproteobacteria bacterium]
MPRITLFKKILIITLLLTLLPLLASSLILLLNLDSINTRLTSEIADTADIQASESLQMRAQHVAETIANFLRQCENDLLFLSRTPLDQQNLLNFYEIRRSEIWERHATHTGPREVRRQVPLYRSFAFIDSRGKERIVIRDGRFLTPSELRDVSTPSGTEFKSEDYFNRIKQLRRGEIYVSHLTGFHVSKQEQLAGASEPEYAFDGASYQGVLRFGSPLFSPDGSFIGMVVISLDHRHLMEFTQHIDPGKNFSTVFPSYQSGNYAFLFDDEGWIITHPKYWDLRGVDDNGRQVPPYSAKSSQADIEAGRIPFNLDHAGFIHPNYPVVAAKVRARRTGYVDITNVGGAKKIMAFAPISYDTGDYRRHGVFGGVTIGFQVDQFHDAARKGSRMINRELREHRTLSALIILLTALLSALSAWLLSRGISRPLRQLTDGARRLAAGDTHERVPVTSSNEIGNLASSFNFMADELERRKQSLLSTLDELRHSRLEILDERNFKTSVLESISSAIVTFSPEGLLTSINGTGRAFLGSETSVDMHFRYVFRSWGNLGDRIDRVLSTHSGYGREPFTIDRGSGMTYFDVGLFPIGSDAEMGLTVTMRNETEKEKLREEMLRLDRLASLGKLSAGIAHEVRNPLTGISLLLDDLHDHAALAADDQAMINKALAEIERVERLINALLNYSSPPRSDFRMGNLNMVANDTVLLMRRQCERQKVNIQLNAGELPSFKFDPEKIKQALLNITRNALEAMPGGGEIRLSTTSDAERVTITISDNGPGIREEDLPLIFEPFFTRKGAGTGLGLSITQRVVEEHHGLIRVESTAGAGTSFILELPIAVNP